MHRVAGRVISVAVLLVLGLALSRLALGPGFDPPGHYDGDDDDAGLIWRTLSCADIPVVTSRPTFVPTVSSECLAPRLSAGPQHVTREPLGSRAPPSGRASFVS
jgi:hypothetical protein